MNSLLEGTIEFILTKILNSASLMIKLTLTLEHRDDLIEVRKTGNINSTVSFVVVAFPFYPRISFQVCVPLSKVMLTQST